MDILWLDAPKDSLTAFLDMLRAAQFDTEKQSLEKTTLIVAESIRPNELAKRQEDKHSESWRAMSLPNAPLSKRVEGFQTAPVWHEKALAAHFENMIEDKQMATACEAFRKVAAGSGRRVALAAPA